MKNAPHCLAFHLTRWPSLLRSGGPPRYLSHTVCAHAKDRRWRRAFRRLRDFVCLRVLVLVAEPAETGTGKLASPLRTSAARSCRRREERAASNSPQRLPTQARRTHTFRFSPTSRRTTGVPQEGRALQKDGACRADDRQSLGFGGRHGDG